MTVPIVTRGERATSRYSTAPTPDSLADVLERVLDRGIVIAGDIVVHLLDIELLTLKLRLVVASVDTAAKMGMDWWTRDPFLSSHARDIRVDAENQALRERIETLERRLAIPELEGDPDTPLAPPDVDGGPP